MFTLTITFSRSLIAFDWKLLKGHNRFLGPESRLTLYKNWVSDWLAAIVIFYFLCLLTLVWYSYLNPLKQSLVPEVFLDFYSSREASELRGSLATLSCGQTFRKTSGARVSETWHWWIYSDLKYINQTYHVICEKFGFYRKILHWERSVCIFCKTEVWDFS